MRYCDCDQIQILAVDDNIFNIVTLQTILEFEFKLKSDKSLNGLEAYNLVKDKMNQAIEKNCPCKRKKSYNLIFMDCNMPVMDGF